MEAGCLSFEQEMALEELPQKAHIQLIRILQTYLLQKAAIIHVSMEEPVA